MGGALPKYFLLLFVFLNTNTLAAEKHHPPANQALARYVANKLALKQNAKKQKELLTEIDESFKEIRKLRQAKKATKDQGACDVCAETAAEFCNRPALYPEFCHDSDCHVDLEPKSDLCYRVYRNDGCYKTLTPNARARVNECWLVDNHISVHEAEAEIDNLKKQLDEVTQEHYDLMKYELALEEECPKCPSARIPASVLREAESELGQ